MLPKVLQCIFHIGSKHTFGGTFSKHKLLFYIRFFLKYVLQLLDRKTNFNLCNVYLLLLCRRKVLRICMSELTLFCPSQLFSQCSSLHTSTSNQLVSFYRDVAIKLLWGNYKQEKLVRNAKKFIWSKVFLNGVLLMLLFQHSGWWLTMLKVSTLRCWRVTNDYNPTYRPVCYWDIHIIW